jgi:hypothetical protein
MRATAFFIAFQLRCACYDMLQFFAHLVLPPLHISLACSISLEDVKDPAKRTIARKDIAKVIPVRKFVMRSAFVSFARVSPSTCRCSPRSTRRARTRGSSKSCVFKCFC